MDRDTLIDLLVKDDLVKETERLTTTLTLVPEMILAVAEFADNSTFRNLMLTSKYFYDLTLGQRSQRYFALRLKKVDNINSAFYMTFTVRDVVFKNFDSSYPWHTITSDVLKNFYSNTIAIEVIDYHIIKKFSKTHPEEELPLALYRISQSQLNFGNLSKKMRALEEVQLATLDGLPPDELWRITRGFPKNGLAARILEKIIELDIETAYGRGWVHTMNHDRAMRLAKIDSYI